MNHIFFMTFSGSILFLFFLIVEKLDRNLFSQKLRYQILKIALFLHIFPLNVFISFLKKECNFILNRNIITHTFIHGYKPVALITSEKPQYNMVFKINHHILVIWISIFCVLFLYYVINFTYSKSYIYKNTQEITSSDILHIRDKYQSKLKIKQNVRIYSTDINCTPFTSGIIKPVIVIPQLKESFEFDIVIHHELYHIRSKDMLILFLRLLITSIYWFNPLVFLLSYKLENYCELACDEFVTEELTYNKRKTYADFIIDLANNSKIFFKKPMIGFSCQMIRKEKKTKNIIKERINTIMNQKKRKTNAAILLSTLLILCSIIPAFAYEPVQKLEYLTDDHSTLYVSSTKDFITYSETTAFEESSTTDVPIYYDNQFIDADGNIYNADEPSCYRVCEHNYSSGTLTNHYVNSDGSCTTIWYNAERCSKCGIIKLGSVIRKVVYAACPH